MMLTIEDVKVVAI